MQELLLRTSVVVLVGGIAIFIFWWGGKLAGL